MPDEGLCVYVVGEDEVHRALAMALLLSVAGRLTRELGADWFDLEQAIRWSALVERDEVAERRRWTDTHADVALAHRKRLMGHINGRPVGPGAQKLRGKLVECVRASRPAALVVLFHDTDGDPRLIEGARQVLDWAQGEPDLPPVALASSSPEGEGWFMLSPRLDEAQRQRLAEATRALPFNPAQHPEELSSKPSDLKDAKRVVQFVRLGAGPSLDRTVSRSLTHEEADQLAAELADSLDHLAVFEACGIAPFLRDLRRALLGLFADHLPQQGPSGRA